MKFVKKILIFLGFFLSIVIYGQEVITAPERTPEQEANRQTEKMQQELNLTPDQAKKVYEINLRYARERQISNSRAEAIERTRNKEVEMKKVLTEDQFARLQDKRYDQTKYRPNTPVEINTTYNNNQNRVPATYRTRQLSPTPAQNSSYSSFRAGNEQQNQRQTTSSSNNTVTPSAANTQRSVPSATNGNSRSVPSSNNTRSAVPAGSTNSNYRAVPSSNSSAIPSSRNNNNSNNNTAPQTPVRPGSNAANQTNTRR